MPKTGTLKLVALSGSVRSGSLNSALLRAAIELSPPGVEWDLASIRGVPVYDADLESASGLPPEVVELKERVARGDGLLVATPEYNNSIPGPLKNAIDWMSRPPQDIPRVFGRRPIGLIGATPGRAGTRLSQAAWLPILRLFDMRPFWANALYVDQAGASFDAEGRLTDPKLRELLQKYVAAFVEFVKAG